MRVFAIWRVVGGLIGIPGNFKTWADMYLMRYTRLGDGEFSISDEAPAGRVLSDGSGW